MTSVLQIGLRAGERIYINGAVLRVDRKVRIELLNDATFLLGSHVMQIDDATTPLRQLYFLVQSLLMEPRIAGSLGPAIDVSIAALLHQDDRDLIADLTRVSSLVRKGSHFDALKLVRQLISHAELPSGQVNLPPGKWKVA